VRIIKKLFLMYLVFADDLWILRQGGGEWILRQGVGCGVVRRFGRGRACIDRPKERRKERKKKERKKSKERSSFHIHFLHHFQQELKMLSYCRRFSSFLSFDVLSWWSLTNSIFPGSLLKLGEGEGRGEAQTCIKLLG